MTIAFIAIATAMVVATLALLVLPLIRRSRRDGRSRAVFATAVALVFAVPAATWGLYHMVGNPAALNPKAIKPPKMTVDQALTQLRARLKKHPKDLQGWLVLGQANTMLNKPAEARAAYAKALALAPDNPNIMVSLAEADSLSRPDHAITGSSRALLQKAIKADPRNQRGLWLLGISDFQAGHFADASLTWRRLQALLPADSKVADAVTRQIAIADARAAGKTQAQAQQMVAGQSASAHPASAHGPKLTVQVSLAPALKDKLKAGDTVFVFARAPKGPPMPLAVTRLSADKLPATVTLTDAMSMAPGMDLSSTKRVTITARISRSGQAIAQTGDLEGSVPAVAVTTAQPVKVVIDHVH
jgi:cytochrome c-type biogenesis protein CcmH